MVQVPPKDLDVLVSALAAVMLKNREFLARDVDEETRAVYVEQRRVFDKYASRIGHNSRRPGMPRPEEVSG